MRNRHPVHLGAPALVAVAFISAAVFGQSEGPVPFGPLNVIDNTANNPRTIWAADIDGDGRIDVITASLADNRVAWYRNEGGSPPTFTKYVIDSTAQGAREVYAADINKNGRMDILAASRANNTVSWYENNGGSPPTFTKHVIANNVIGAWSVYAEDINANGRLDVLSVGRDDDTVVWFENLGGNPPAWAKRTITFNARRAQRVYAADVNGNGHMDILSASGQDRKISWYESDGNYPTPSFTEHIITTNAQNAKWVWAVDLNGNGRMDVLSASEGNNRIRWYENDGANPPGFIQRDIMILPNAKMVLPFDINRDGRMDLIACGVGEESAVVWIENLGGNPPAFQPHLVSSEAQNPLTVFAADLTGDGDLDMLSASFIDNTFAWYENREIHRSAVFDARRTATTEAPGAWSVRVADVDRDGAPDIVVAAPYSDEVLLLRSDGAPSPTFSRIVVGSGVPDPRSVDVADINRDGAPDIVVAAESADAVYWFENDGASPPSFVQRTVATNVIRPRAVRAIDLDRDGLVDVVSASRVDNTIAWHRNTGGSPPSFVTHIVSSNAQGAESVDAADINRNGRIDIVAASANDGKIAWHENTGGSPPAFVERVLTTNASGASAVVIADVNRDGRPDIVAASSLDNTVRVFLNQGGNPAVFTEHVVVDDATGVTAVRVEDLDADGWPDIVWAASTDQRIEWARNLGGTTPVFERREVPGSLAFPRGLAIADLNRDGWPDIIVAARTDGSVRWFPHRGGQYGLETFDVAPESLANGGSADVLEIVAHHRGVEGDTDIQLDSLSVLLQKRGPDLFTPYQPMSSAEAASVFESIKVLSSISGGPPAVIASVSTYSLDAKGRLIIPIVPGSPEALLAFDEPRTLALRATMTANASSFPASIFRFVHEPEAAMAYDAEAGAQAPVRVEPGDPVPSTLVNGIPLDCPGDTNGDGVVDFVDLATVLTNFGQSGDQLMGDLNGDGVVDFADLSLVLSNFGMDCVP